MLTLQASANQDIVADFTADPTVDGEPVDWPVIEGRMAFTIGRRGKGFRPIELAVAGHVGEQGFDFTEIGPPPDDLPAADDVRLRTWSLNVDFKAPITDRLGVQGEFFHGANLSVFLGGIGQGVCPCLRVPIRSTGGWLDVWYDWTPRLHSHFGFGIDDPRNGDMRFGRRYNQFIFGNLSYDVTSKLTTGFEVAYWQTLYFDSRAGIIPDDDLGPSAPGKAVVLEWMVKYGF
jgi:hypothetical protein